jgi:hypothetical protein
VRAKQNTVEDKLANLPTHLTSDMTRRHLEMTRSTINIGNNRLANHYIKMQSSSYQGLLDSSFNKQVGAILGAHEQAHVEWAAAFII